MIERTEDIHEEGTLRAVTRWVTGHDEGISELFKNVRRAYQADRLDVADEHRAAVLLIKDGDPRRGRPARFVSSAPPRYATFSAFRGTVAGPPMLLGAVRSLVRV
jgi:hypothetical protein